MREQVQCIMEGDYYNEHGYLTSERPACASIAELEFELQQWQARFKEVEQDYMRVERERDTLEAENAWLRAAADCDVASAFAELGECQKALEGWRNAAIELSESHTQRVAEILAYREHTDKIRTILIDLLSSETFEHNEWSRQIRALLDLTAPEQHSPDARWNHVISCYGCGEVIGYSSVITPAMDGALCALCARAVSAPDAGEEEGK